MCHVGCKRQEKGGLERRCRRAPQDYASRTLLAPSTLTWTVCCFLGCNGATSDWQPLGGLSRSERFSCAVGWGGQKCDVDVLAPMITCEPGIISLKVYGQEGNHTVTSNEIPLPSIHGTGPTFGQTLTVELTSIDSRLEGGR